MDGASEQKLLNLRTVFSETNRVVKSQGRVFLTLAFLFLFPSSLAVVLYPLIAKSVFGDKTSAAFVLSLAYYLGSLVLSPCVIASITYTVLHGFNGEPVKLKEAVKSIAGSYVPLLGTALAVQPLFLYVTLGFALFALFQPGCVAAGLVSAVCLSIMLYLQMNLSLATAVVVAESSSGLASLKRSRTLVKGKRGLALRLNLMFVLYYIPFLWSNYNTSEFDAARLSGESHPSTAAEWCSLIFDLALLFLFGALYTMMVNLFSVIAGAVMYVYCRDIEKAGGGDYLSLPADDDEAASVV